MTAIRSAVSPSTAELFGDHQHGVVDAIAGLAVADSAAVCQQWRRQAEAVVEMPEPKVAERSWKVSTLDDGTMVGRFVFDPAAAAQLERAIGTARVWDGPNDQRSTGTRNADAMFDVVTFFNANHDRDGTPRHRPHVEVHIDGDHWFTPHVDPDDDDAGADETSDGSDRGHGAAVTDSGRFVPSWATGALTCDCVMHRVLRAGSAVTDYGRATRTVPKDLFRAVACRDGGCRFPGCTRKVAWCDAHHIRWWRNHGETKLDNLLLLCSRHHHLIHRDRWHIQLDTSGTATFTTPDRRCLVSQPRGDPRIRSPIAA